ncbi:MAG TPA: Do family serine endopeptidase [Methylocystis sp.]|nr:Do family serine endopeptidase [Methylocystis sp.]
MHSSALRRLRRPLRAALLCAGAALALAAGVHGLQPSSAARAEAPLSEAVAPASGPASFADVVERVKGAVVAIKVKSVEVGQAFPEGGPELSPDDPFYEFFKRFGEGQGRPRRQLLQSQGSGFVISPDGYVVTNNHVVEHATEVEVVFDGGKTLPAKIVGTDKRTDLALLKLNVGDKLPYVEWSTTPPRIGDWVIAIGNPFGLGGTVTAGIVSARGRDIGAGPYDDFLQIDAPVNRGNSGGPAFDTHGAVIGVNTAIYSPSGGSVGIGFAIPTEVAKDVIATLKDKHSVTRGWIGVSIQPLTQDIADGMGLKSAKGALIAQPVRGGPAESAGLKAGDVIVAVDGAKIDTARELQRKIGGLPPGAPVELTYLRAGAEKKASVKLGTLPDQKEARAEIGPPDRESHAMADLGIDVAPASRLGRGGEGLYVVDVDPEGRAAQKGIRRGDVILEAGGQSVSDSADLAHAFDAARKDGRRSVLLRVKSVEGVRFVAVPVEG